MHQYKHSLVIGGTGMLAEATLAICRQSQHVTIVARHADAFVAKHTLPNSHALAIDYTDKPLFVSSIEETISGRGAFDLAVLWMHGTGEDSLIKLLDILTERPCSVIHVLGSASGDPREQSNRVVQKASACGNVNYMRTILGCKETDGGRRWLNHDEISRGVLDTLAKKKDVVVGDLRA